VISGRGIGTAAFRLDFFMINMIKWKVKSAGFVVLAALCLLPAGCSEKGSESDEAVFRYPLPVKVKSLDPGNIDDVYSNLVVSHICEPLYTYHYLKRPFEVIPLLAEALPVISPDKLTYTIRIKQGVYFQDDPCFPDRKGRQLKAEDFVFAFKRIANVRYASVNWGSFKERIAGLDDFREYTKQFKDEFEVDYSKEVEGLQAIDDYTLQIRLTKPWPQLLDDLTSAATAPVAKEAVDYYRKDIMVHPVGTGPYRLKKWARGVFLELERNPAFRGDCYPSDGEPADAAAGLLADAGKTLPFIDRIVFRIIEEEQPAWLLFLRGDMEMMGIPKDNFATAVDMQAQRPKDFLEQRKIQLAISDQPSLYYIGFNMQDAVLGQNKPLRQALNYAFDSEKLNDLFYNGRWRVAHSIIHPLLNEYDPNVVNEPYMGFDMQKARRLLAEAQRIQGGPIPELTIGMTGGDPFSRQFGQFVQRQFESLGLKVRLDFTDWPTYVEKMNKGQHQIFGGGGVRFSTPDALNVLMMFATKYFAPLGNFFFYSNPEFDRLYNQAEVMFPCAERTQLYRKMERIVLEDCPAIFTNHRVQYTLYHGWIKNYKPHPYIYDTMKYIRIDTAEQKNYKRRVRELEKKKL